MKKFLKRMAVITSVCFGGAAAVFFAANPRNSGDLLDDAIRLTHDFALAASPFHEPPVRGLVGPELRHYVPDLHKTGNHAAVPAITLPEGDGLLIKSERYHCRSLQERLAATEDYRSEAIRDMKREEIAEDMNRVTNLELDEPMSNADLSFINNLRKKALENGLEEEANELRRDLLLEFNVPKDFRRWADAKLDNVFAKMARDEWLMENLQSWVLPRAYKDEQHATQQYWLRRNTMQHIANYMRAEFGLPTVPLSVSVLPEDSAVLGYYVPGNCRSMYGSVTLNYHDKWGVLDTPETSLGTIMEEALHSIDDYLSKALLRGDLKPDHPAYQHAAVFTINREKYLRPETVTFLGVPVWEKGFSDYKNQYLERSAKQRKEKLVEQFTNMIDEYEARGIPETTTTRTTKPAATARAFTSS